MKKNTAPSENKTADQLLTEKIPDSDLKTSLTVMAKLAEQPELIAHLSQEERITLMKAAGKLAHPTMQDNRKIARASRKIRSKTRQNHDREIRKMSGIREARTEKVFVAPKQIASSVQSALELKKPRNCYVCKELFTTVHFFYDSMCPKCADYNYQKRFQSVSLESRTALVTGGRVKIGYQTALKLLRAGARTIVTTRFPQDSALRFSRETDFDSWRHRLQIHGLDLRHSPSVEMFARYLVNTEERLDFLVNNAAQTVRKPPGFYKHLMDWETKSVKELPIELQSLLSAHETCKRALEGALLPGSDQAFDTNALLKVWPGKTPAIGIRASAKLSMIPYECGDDSTTNTEVFPEGKLDADLQQVDLRSINSWRLSLADVTTSEMLEVHLVNAVAPFVLAAKLKPLMTRNKSEDKHIVNASAMEGKFLRFTKTDKHPHTNMAKAALNMLTLTSAPDYKKSGIHMNAVDTGWITDEDPAELSQAKKTEHDFEPPLDIVDGAARLLDPIFDGIATGQHYFGKFLKDYKPTDW